jgi:hypothetical protein
MLHRRGIENPGGTALAAYNSKIRKGANIMKFYRYFLGAVMGGALLISPADLRAHYDGSRPEIPGPSAMEGMEEPSTVMYSEFAAVDLCYQGSIVDPDTGEILDLFVQCSDDAIEGNLDLA